MPPRGGGCNIVNDYYTEAFTGQRRGLASVEQIVSSLKRIEAAFDKLPALRALLEDRVTAVTATSSNGVAYTVTMDPAPTQYTDGMALNVRFPRVSEGNPTLDILDGNSMSLGAKPIRDVSGQALTAGAISENVRAELYYVDQGSGYWILGAGGARGIPGPAGPPDGQFYIISGTTQLGFRDTGGTPVHNFGQIAFFNRGAYDNATTYKFLDVVRSGNNLYIHFGLADTTGAAVTDTTVWQALVTGLETGAFVATGTGDGNVALLDSAGEFASARIGKVDDRRSGSLEFWSGTQAQYTAVATKDANTLYFTE